MEQTKENQYRTKGKIFARLTFITAIINIALLLVQLLVRFLRMNIILRIVSIIRRIDEVALIVSLLALIYCAFIVWSEKQKNETV